MFRYSIVNRDTPQSVRTRQDVLLALSTLNDPIERRSIYNTEDIGVVLMDMNRRLEKIEAMLEKEKE